MSLDTVPKTNFESDDGMDFTDVNEIGANLQALEDSKNQDGDSPTYVDVNATTETVGTSNITTINSTTVNNSGFITSNYKSSDGSEGINNSNLIVGGFIYTFKDGLLVSRIAT